jgi:predicted membrane protein
LYEVVHKYVFNYMKLILFIIPFFAIYFSLLTYWYADLWDSYDIMYE